MTCFITEEILKHHIKNYFQISGKQTIQMPRNGEYFKLKIFERKTKSPSMICAYFENILVSKDNRKQNPNESYTNKYPKNVACSYGYKLICVDD